MKKRISMLLVILWMIIIFIMSSFDATESGNQSGIIVNFIANIFNISNLDVLSVIIRKIAHFTEYFVLGILVYNLIRNYDGKVYVAVLICLLYAVSDEVHQLYVPGRSCQLLDICIDIIGSICGIFIYKYILRLFKRNKGR